MNESMRVRAMLVVVLFSLGFTIISGRLVYLQLVCHEKFQNEAVRNQYAIVPVPALRGRILDAQGRVLVQSVTTIDLRIDGKVASENPDSLDAVAKTLQMPVETLRSQIKPDDRYILIRPDLDTALQESLKNLKNRSLIFVSRVRRSYPNGAEASHVIGFTNEIMRKVENYPQPIAMEKGVYGIEQVADNYLSGIAGERRIVLNGSRKEIAAYRQYDRQPRNGLDVVLTVDQVVQHVIEEEADRLVRDFSPKTVSIIVLRPSTGEVLGMTNRPTFDPNDRKTMAEPENLKNCAISNMYEPGSTFKIVTTAAVLSEGVADLDTPIYCENGRFFYAGHWLEDTSPHGTLSLREALKVSSNIGFAKLGLALGEDRMYRQIRLMGFGEVTQAPGMALPGEQRGMLRPPSNWSKVSLTRLPIGYEVAVTNLQMALAMGAIANEGKLMEPRLIKAVVDSNGRVVKQFLPRVVRQVVTREVAAKVTKALEGVLEEGGTATLAKVANFTAAGKTGTAYKLVNGAYGSSAYYSSFVGFLPSDNPQFLVSIVVDEPQGPMHFGGKVAGPAFRNIATQVAQQLNLLPEGTQTVLARRVQP